MKAFKKVNRRRPTLPPNRPGSTIGAERLNFRVRNGNGCDPLAMATENLILVVSRRCRSAGVRYFMQLRTDQGHTANFFLYKKLTIEQFLQYGVIQR